MLYLIPVYLGENSSLNVFPKEVIDTIKRLRYFIVENEKSARKFIRFIDPEVDQSSLHFQLIDKRFSESDIPEVTIYLQEGKEVGLLSEAGTPCIADPGNIVVHWAHQNGVQVKPMVGPSSIYLSLMASGLNGQNFQFHGYLPIDKSEKRKRLKQLELESRKEQKTQIFMETPYRNNALLEDLFSSLSQECRLCIATEVSLPEEQIHTSTIKEWKSRKIEIHKKPSIFLIQAD